MIDIFSPIFNDVTNIILDSPTLPYPSGFTSKLYNILGDPIITATILHSDGTASGLALVNPLFIFAGILACIGVYSIFKLIGVFLNSL